MYPLAKLDPMYRDQMHQEIQNVGVVIGKKIIDCITRNKQDLPQTLTQVVTFLAIDFWSYIFGKKVDHVKTDNVSVFELSDNNKFIGRISSAASYDKEDFNAIEECKMR